MPKRILIAEDDTQLADRLCEKLEYRGFSVDIVITGPDAVKAVEANRYDAVMVAVMLPGLHGIRVLEQVRALPNGRNATAILMSAVYRSPELFAADIERLDVLEFLTKPFAIEDVADRVETVLLGWDSGFFVATTAVHSEVSVDTPGDVVPEKKTRDETEDSFMPIDMGRSLQSAGEMSAARWIQALTTLFQSHSSGRLRANFDGDERVLYFLNGYPVWVRTAEGTRSLAQWLTDEQILMPRDLERVLASVEEKRWSTRKAVIEMGLVAPGDLAPLLEGWVAAALELGLRSPGSFEFSASDDFAADIPVHEVNPLTVLWQGVKRNVSREQIAEDLTSWSDSWVGKTSTFARLFAYFSDSEMPGLGDFLEKRRPLETVLQHYGDSSRAAHAVWMMRHAGLLGFTTDPGAPRTSEKSRKAAPPRKVRPPTEEIEARTYSAATIDRLRKTSTKTPPPAVGNRALEAQLLAEYLTKIDEDHYTFLGVSRMAKPDEIVAAYDRQAATYRRAGRMVQGDALRKSKELFAHLVSVFEELRDPARRADYDERLRRKLLGLPELPRPSVPIGDDDPPSVNALWEDIDSAPELPDAKALFGSNAGYPPALSNRQLDAEASHLGRKGSEWVEARRRMLQSDWRRAYILLDEIRAELPDHPTVLADLGWCRFVLAEGDPEAIETALEWADLALTFHPKHLGGAEVKARILCREDSEATAEDRIRSLERLLRLSPGMPWAESRMNELARTAKRAEGKDRQGLRGLFRRKS